MTVLFLGSELILDQDILDTFLELLLARQLEKRQRL